MKMIYEKNIKKIHTTELGEKRIRKNVLEDISDVIEWIKNKVSDSNAIISKIGKNWYVSIDYYIITINASNYCTITVHKKNL